MCVRYSTVFSTAPQNGTHERDTLSSVLTLVQNGLNLQQMFKVLFLDISLATKIKCHLKMLLIKTGMLLKALGIH